ncbi:MAG TPA: TrmH family RNA methyltransferase, partial [Candidatus Paceibacterota bacterium]|nr:TrmH family RNA methyltransferase [Candidatus Paceibacterota bacterium]
MKNKENILILHNIRSVENVGAMFRTADAAGIDKIYLTGYTPAPIDRFGRKRKDLAKSALGAEEFVSWEHKKTIAP